MFFCVLVHVKRSKKKKKKNQGQGRIVILSNLHHVKHTYCFILTWSEDRKMCYKWKLKRNKLGTDVRKYYFMQRIINM